MEGLEVSAGSEEGSLEEGWEESVGIGLSTVCGWDEGESVISCKLVGLDLVTKCKSWEVTSSVSESIVSKSNLRRVSSREGEGESSCKGCAVRGVCCKGADATGSWGIGWT